MLVSGPPGLQTGARTSGVRRLPPGGQGPAVKLSQVWCSRGCGQNLSTSPAPHGDWHSAGALPWRQPSPQSLPPRPVGLSLGPTSLVYKDISHVGFGPPARTLQTRSRSQVRASGLPRHVGETVQRMTPRLCPLQSGQLCLPFLFTRKMSTGGGHRAQAHATLPTCKRRSSWSDPTDPESCSQGGGLCSAR